jgi:hypothetical protein
MAIRSLAKGKGDMQSVRSSDVYAVFERQFNERLESGFFDQYDWIGFDSATTLLDLMMDRVLSINDRFGQWPQEDDYGPQMIAFINLCRNITSMDKGLYVTGHLEVKQDNKTKKVSRRPMMTGRLTAKVPLLFSDIFATDVEVDDKGVPLYRLQTVPDPLTVIIRTSIKGLEPFENVTVDFSKDPVGQGLGGILRWERKQTQGDTK